MAPLRLAVLFLACATAAPAVEVRFVPATAEGTVSLGIYDEAGKLMRVLCDEWPIGRFTAGLNGLSTDWDGKDSSGQVVPSGTYRARGFVAGDVSVEGVALHFNDWIVSDETPRIASVGAVALLPGGDLLLAARLPESAGALLRYSPAAPEPFRVLAPLDHLPDRMQIAAAGGRIFLLRDQRVLMFDSATGKEQPPPPSDMRCESMSANGDRLAVRAGGKIWIYAAGDWTKQSECALPDVPVRDFALLEGGPMAVVGEDGSLWFGGPDWKKIELPEGSAAQQVAAGRAGTFWVSERMPSGEVMVAQYSAEEGRLAEWASGQNAEAAGLAASGEGDQFCVVLRGTAAERTVSIERNSATGWGVVTDKTITDSKSFGLLDGKLSASSGTAPLDLSLNLQANPLDAAAPATLAVRAVEFAGGGTGLATSDGLPLVRVTQEAGGRLMAVAGSSADTAQFHRGDGVCVEEYAITRLGNITSFDAGTIEMEGGAEKPAPPEEEIPEPSP